MVPTRVTSRLPQVLLEGLPGFMIIIVYCYYYEIDVLF